MNAASATTREPPAPRSTAFLHPLWLTLAGVVLALIAHFAMLWRLPFPQCLLRRFTGLPCPTCGCTRSLAAWAEFDLGAALRFNPLFFFACVGLLLWLAAWVVERVSGRAFLAAPRACAARWPWWRILLALAAANWVYLCFTLPR